MKAVPAILFLILIATFGSGCASREEEEKLSYDPGPYSAEIDRRLNTPLRVAITFCEVEYAVALIEKGENLDYAYSKAAPSSPDTLTPLEYAAELLRTEDDPERRRKLEFIIDRLTAKLAVQKEKKEADAAEAGSQ